MLADRPLHPTMWIRMWFADGDKLHQRGYTLVDPNPQDDTVDIEFALHDGVASHWAQNAQPGDTVEATVLGSNFTLPEPQPAGYVIVGDSASLPAINSLLEAIGDTPARVFLEAGHDEDNQLPVARRTDVVWVDRKNAGEALVEAVALVGVRRHRPLRLGGVRQPHHPRGVEGVPRGLQDPAQIHQGAGLLGGVIVLGGLVQGDPTAARLRQHDRRQYGDHDHRPQHDGDRAGHQDRRVAIGQREGAAQLLLGDRTENQADDSGRHRNSGLHHQQAE